MLKTKNIRAVLLLGASRPMIKIVISKGPYSIVPMELWNKTYPRGNFHTKGSVKYVNSMYSQFMVLDSYANSVLTAISQ